jgi:phosphoribosylformylglycinamidine cyclo-ligase
VLPEGCDAVVELGSWPLTALWSLVREAAAGFSTTELYRTVNMGIGMVLVVSPDDVPAVQSAVGEPTWVIGSITHGSRKVVLQ